ncbi:hypothetical protein SAMN04487764_2175 [Gillisia sp. Hel1_33_143]|uniref:hypothetical protein n=1 Tax=Gillisia sp. Hel1_33_143 TaxID=1336796 RepID=UPI00087CCA35|nr:hypothetical protein [Gillisia sp. Hel1_33_143]SDS41963.1 hypothetical protein SAMN04487764_2175 [Gillisia sp. Hel1_33_143]
MKNKSESFKIGFLFLDEIHHINHFISVAAELAKNHEVSILTYKNPDPYLFKCINRFQPTALKIEELSTSPFRALTDKLKDRKLPRKGFWIKKNKKYITDNFDAVVFTDYFQKYLLGTHIKLIKFPHGTPGRAYSYNPAQLDFDFQLLFGEFHHQQFKELNLLGKNPVVVGYPKLDAVKNLKKKNFFKNQKPVVIYNPHFDSELSSWNKFGLEILAYFYNQDKYNLIFAPHLHLFQELKGGENKEQIPKRFLDAPHIHIDLGSAASTDMQLVNAADLYLGDVSSQVYEFIINPRPCLFLNTNGIDYKEDINYRFWQSGLVIDRIKDLDSDLSQAFLSFDEYRPVQEKLNLENYFVQEGSTPSIRAAQSIIKFLNS